MGIFMKEKDPELENIIPNLKTPLLKETGLKMRDLDMVNKIFRMDLSIRERGRKDGWNLEHLNGWMVQSIMESLLRINLKEMET